MTDVRESACASSCASRRAVLVGAGAVAAATLTGCQAYGEPRSNSPAAPATGGANAGVTLAQTGDIPVGGGKIFADKGVVVTQPKAGEFKAFTAICTHQGCTVTGVSGGTINCDCHGSKFKVADGSVASGPAGSPLAAVKVSVDGGAIKLA